MKDTTQGLTVCTSKSSRQSEASFCRSATFLSSSGKDGASWSLALALSPKTSVIFRIFASMSSEALRAYQHQIPIHGGNVITVVGVVISKESTDDRHRHGSSSSLVMAVFPRQHHALGHP